jgi:hypothetical protein
MVMVVATMLLFLVIFVPNVDATYTYFGGARLPYEDFLILCGLELRLDPGCNLEKVESTI